jgi:tRNA (cmo5U34)-methyltransferase
MEMGQFHFRPDDYLELMHAELPAYEELQEQVSAATRGIEAARILELGTGTGETARRVLSAHPAARLTGLDVSDEMLAAARSTLAPHQIERLTARPIQEPLPQGPFDLVISALTIHHLDDRAKAGLFAKVAEALRPGGRFVMGDVVVPDDPEDAVTPLSPDYDLPSTTSQLLAWLADAGFSAELLWRWRDLVVIRADRALGPG